MPSNLMETLKLAANWLQIEGVEGVSANEDKKCIEVFISKNFNKKLNAIPKIYHGLNIVLIKND